MTDLIKHSGQVFTPEYIVRLMLDEAGYQGEQILGKHCMENSCGDGAFLCEIIRRYSSAYYDRHKSFAGIEKDLRTYIHGIELEPNAYQCCRENVASLLASLSLPADAVDLINADAMKIGRFDGKMDYVIGNPPYVRVHNLDGNFDAVKSFAFANGGMTDMYLVFFEIGFRMLKNGGKLCYITPSSWLNSVAGSNLRRYIRLHRNLLSVIDFEHFQAFKATTYTLVSLFVKDESHDAFDYNVFDEVLYDKRFVQRLTFDEVDVNKCFYLAPRPALALLKDIMISKPSKFVSVKNGFATLADDVFICSGFPFSDYVIPVIKASTGKWYEALFPYDKFGKPVNKDDLFSKPGVAAYFEAHKQALLKGKDEKENPDWFIYGRSQALKDVCKNKISINTTVKDLKSLKLNSVPSGCGVYSGLYILTDFCLDVIEEILFTEDFISYVSSLKKYKSGGYYTFNSKELEQYLNYTLNKKINDGEVIMPPVGKQYAFEGCQTFF